jgi:alpha-tubulin suppressor-like RCC1 family protein
VPDLISSRSTTATARHEAILLTTGQVLCLGDNCFGQRIVPSIPAAKKVSCGDFHTLALCVDGTVAAWGWNSSGQLAVPKDLRALDIEAIGFSSWAISLTGSLHCWGRVKDANELSMSVTDEAWLRFAMTHVAKVKLRLFPEHIRKSREFKAIKSMRRLAGD